MELKFKEWLLNEDGFDDSGSDWFYGSYLRPSDAFDWSYAWPYPGDFYFLQSRWRNEREEGRKFHGLDLDKVLATKFVSIQSNTMPDDKPGFWVHSEKERPDWTVVTHPEVELIGIQKDPNGRPAVLSVSNDLLDKKKELDARFGKIEPWKPMDKPKELP
jgi:hypothetical protein